MMKASVTNLLGNLSIGDGEAVARSMGELVESASTFFFGNFIPMLQTIFSNLTYSNRNSGRKGSSSDLRKMYYHSLHLSRMQSLQGWVISVLILEHYKLFSISFLM
jgi:hypothetical protein